LTVLRLGTDTAPERPQVDVFGHLYRLRSITRSVQAGLQKAYEAMDAMQAEADADKVIAQLAEVFDVLLEPEEHKTKAKTVLVQKWKADELAMGAIRQFAQKLEEQAVEADRPT
jgi:hypothetical protein